MQNRPYIFALDLKDCEGAAEAYRAWHRPGVVPAAVIESIRGADIADLEIYLCGNRLMMLLIPGPTFDPTLKARGDDTNPSVQEWEALMWEFQQALPFAAFGQKWVPMERIFWLADQL